MATTNKKINFSYFERKQDFTAALQAELANNIVFVEDTKEVFTHGEFFGIRNVTLNYDSSTARLQLKDGGVVVSEMDATSFVKDGMLDSVSLVKTQESGVSEAVPYLKFVFNTDAGKSAVRLSVSDLVDSYDGSSIALTQAFAPASSYSAPMAGDSVDVAVGKLLKGHSDNVTALSQKQAAITGAATTVTMNDLTSDRALASSGSGKIAVSTTTATELGYVHGVTSGIQAQIDGKQPTITGAASTITTANLTASKVLGSDANGKVAATSIATTDAEDAVSKRHTQNTDTRILSPNQGNSVTCTNAGTVINGITSISGSLSVSGNLNVTGKETVEEIVNIKSENNFITLRDGAQTAIASGSLSGTKVENYDGLGNDLLFGTDASGVFRIGDDGGTLEPIATRDEAANLTDGQLMKWDAANQRMVGINDIRANTVNGAPLSNAASYFYGVSTSAANATQKEVSIPSITVLNAGQVIVVTATNPSDHINNATLKLNNFTAYPISVKNNYFANGRVIGTGLSIFMFDGSKWCMLNWDSAYDAISVEEGTAGTSTAVRLVRADYLQQIIHGQIDKFVGTRAMSEDDYWDEVTAGTVQPNTLYITFDNDWEG